MKHLQFSWLLYLFVLLAVCQKLLILFVPGGTRRWRGEETLPIVFALVNIDHVVKSSNNVSFVETDPHIFNKAACLRDCFLFILFHLVEDVLARCNNIVAFQVEAQNALVTVGLIQVDLLERTKLPVTEGIVALFIGHQQTFQLLFHHRHHLLQLFVSRLFRLHQLIHYFLELISDFLLDFATFGRQNLNQLFLRNIALKSLLNMRFLIEDSKYLVIVLLVGIVDFLQTSKIVSLMLSEDSTLGTESLVVVDAHHFDRLLMKKTHFHFYFLR